MENEKSPTRTGSTIRDLYPALTEDELKEGEANLRRYFEIAHEIVREQVVRDADFDIAPNPATMKERSNANLKS